VDKIKKNDMKKVHFGCSDRFPGPIDGWDNLDIFPRNNKIIKCDVINGLPYKNNTISHIFSVHTFEHFTLNQCKKVLNDCYNKMCISGVIRIIVPDLRRIVSDFEDFENSQFFNKFENKWEFLLYAMYDTDSTSTPHKYMFYDENLIRELTIIGFKNIKIVSDDNSKSEYKEFNEIVNFPIKSLAIEGEK